MTLTTYPVKSTQPHETHRAGWIIVDPFTIIENGYIEIANQRIIQVGHGTLPSKTHCTDHGPGVLMPCLVNAHLHLELSALKNKISFSSGFTPWVQTLLAKRDALSRDKLIKSGQQAAIQLKQCGHLHIADISTLGLGRKILSGTGLKGFSFHEFLGPLQSLPHTETAGGISFSLAGHAPHTSSPALLKALKERTNASGLPFSIHLAESGIESEFIESQKGEWADFLTHRGIDFSSWGVGSKTPVEYLHDLGILGPSTLTVHLLETTRSDIELLSGTGAKAVLCPRSNYNLHNKLPDIKAMLQAGMTPALGTDSLASCDSLSIMDEMAFIRTHMPDIPPETVFTMGTLNGARALGISRFTGFLDKGKNDDIIYCDLEARHKHQLLERVTANE